MACRCCGASDLFPVVDFGQLPIAHRLLSDPTEVELTYPLALDCCAQCGFIQVTRFIDPALLYLNYNYCFSAWKPQPHTTDELDLIQRVARAQSVFEVGANDGMFLRQLTNAGLTVAGVEPNPFARQEGEIQGLRLLPGMFDETVALAALHAFGPFDLVVARQVLEHIPDLSGFFGAVELLLTQQGYLLLELPDFASGLAAGDCSTIWEEHVNYFTEPTLANLLRRFGYEVVALRRYNFSGGAITVLARRISRTSEPIRVASVVSIAREFQSKVDRYTARLRRSLADCRSRGERVVLYGVGCRGCIVVNGLRVGDLIEFAVDDQAERTGKYMPGSRLPIYPPDALAATDRPDVVLLAVNQENEAAVRGRLASGIRAVSVLGPNNLWLELDTLDQDRGRAYDRNTAA